jgi:hypothetical protein
MTKPTPMTKGAFARLAGVTPQAIGVATQKGGQLFDALVGRQIDSRHPDAKAYLKRQKAKAEADGAPTKPADLSPDPGAPQDDGTPGFIDELETLTLRQVEDLYGGLPQYNEHLKTLKLHEEIREKRLKNDETDGSLIERELVQVHVFGTIEQFTQRVLTDAPKTIVRAVESAVKSGVAPEQIERQVRAILSKLLEPVKRKAAKVLREAN